MGRDLAQPGYGWKSTSGVALITAEVTRRSHFRLSRHTTSLQVQVFRGECDGGLQLVACSEDLLAFPCCLSTFHDTDDLCLTTTTVFVLVLLLVLLTEMHGSPAKVPRRRACVCAHPVLHACDRRPTPTPLALPTLAHTAAPKVVSPLESIAARVRCP